MFTSFIPSSVRRFASATLALATVVVAACSDAGSAPAAPETALRPAGPRLTLASASVTTAVLYPTYDNVYVSSEGHRITIPAYSVCNPATSGYGPATWNLPCTPATSPILFTITSTTDADGTPRITVFPDVRFSPSKTVTVDFADAAAAAAFSALIKYCPSVGIGCIDESKTDPTLKTYTNRSTGRVYRRIKHFSGYNVVFGLDGGSETMFDRAASKARASGYITTTGLDGATQPSTETDGQ